MKTLCIPLIIALGLAGQTFHANAQTETNLYSFDIGGNQEIEPKAGLVQGRDGNFYGTTYGTYGSVIVADGTVFRISPDGSETNLHIFVGGFLDGANPQAGLVQGSDGNFYGTTYRGGGQGYGYGTVFRITRSGSYANLYQFSGPPTDGAYPAAGLVQSSDGNFYGTTQGGGTNNGGTVFQISPSGNETPLYLFGYPSDGYQPNAGLVQGTDGNFYGTTAFGGLHGYGTVFRISPGGSYTNLYSFAGPPTDGRGPYGGLVQGSDGNFYGTTSGGGTSTNCGVGEGCGTVFRISPSGNETNLYSFGGYPTDGAGPQAGLVLGSDGNFYGTTSYDADGAGNVFRISPSGSYSNLYSFGGGETLAGLVQGSDGNFYGTTVNGGAFFYGSVFRLTVPLNPPANQISGIQLSGTNVVLAIPSVAGETYQLQFSTNLTSGTWLNVHGVSVTNSIGALLTLTNLGGAAGPQGFSRFAITP